MEAVADAVIETVGQWGGHGRRWLRENMAAERDADQRRRVHDGDPGEFGGGEVLGDWDVLGIGGLALGRGSCGEWCCKEREAEEPGDDGDEQCVFHTASLGK